MANGGLFMDGDGNYYNAAAEAAHIELCVGQLRGHVEVAVEDVRADMGDEAADEGFTDLVAAIIGEAPFPAKAKAEYLRREGLTEYRWAGPIMAAAK